MDKKSKIFVAGHRGMVGSAILRELLKSGYNNIITMNSSELDLRDQSKVNQFFQFETPDYVFLAAAKVGGIQANNIYRADFLYDNLMIEANVIHASYINKVKKLLFLGSSCIYPRNAIQPMREDQLLTGELESTNEPYAIAKIAGIKLCESYRDQYGCNFISVMPTNLFGIGDNYHPTESHVIPALIRKFHEAKVSGGDKVSIWGTGRPLREFLYADDLARGCIFLMLNYNEKLFINIGSGNELSIKDLALLIKEVIGFSGEIEFDITKPDGTPRKYMDSERLRELGFQPQTDLVEGLKLAYLDFKEKEQ